MKTSVERSVVVKRPKPINLKAARPKPEKNKRRKKPSLPDAIAVKPGEGETAASIIRMMRNEVDIETTGAHVTSVTESRNGEILIKLKSKEAERLAL